MGRISKSTFRTLFGDTGALSLQLQCNGMQIIEGLNKLNTTKCS